MSPRQTTSSTGYGQQPRQLFVNVWLGCSLSTLIAIVLPNWRHLSGLRSWTVLGFAALVATLNSLLGGVQRLVVGLRCWHGQPEPAPLFIIGHWRSGTTVLHQLLALDPQFTCPSNYVCFCPHHFLLTEWLLADGLESIAPPTRLIDDLPFDADSPQEDEFALLGLGAPSPYRFLAFPASGIEMVGDLERIQVDPRERARWKRTMARLVSGLWLRKRKRAVLKSPAHTLRVQSLLELYPDAQFVWISRNREATIASTVAMWKRLCQSQSFCALNDSRLASDVALSVDAFAKEAADWQASLPASQFYSLQFEALLADPVAEMQQLYAALQLGQFRWSQPALLHLLQSIKSHTPAFPSPAAVHDSEEDNRADNDSGAPVKLSKN